MRIVRYLKRSGSKPAWGWVSEDHVGRLDSSPFGPYGRKEAKDPLERVRLLPPVEPGKIICIGRNYAAHAAEHDAQVPESPLIFLKPPSSVIGPGESILLPPQSENVEHEAELALVIGRGGRWIPPEKAAEHILGYTAANDVTARDLQRIDGQWTRGRDSIHSAQSDRGLKPTSIQRMYSSPAMYPGKCVKWDLHGTWSSLFLHL